MSRILKISWCLVIFLGLPLGAMGQQGGDRLEEIRVKMEETQGLLSKIKAEYSNGQSELKKIQQLLKSLSDKEANLKRELGKVELSHKQSQAVLSEVQGKIESLQELSLKRIRSLYMLGGPQQELLYVTSRSDFDQASVYVSHIRSFDRQLIDELVLLKSKRDDETSKLTKIQAERTELLSKITAQREETDEKLADQKALLSTLEGKKNEYNSTLLGLKAQALRLETVLQGLTGGTAENEPKEPLKESEKKVKLLGFDGNGLPNKLKQSPIRGGHIVSRFGRYKDSVLGEGFRKGIELGGLSGEVSVVEEGRVAYVGRMPQIGSVVIVDHGKRDYSLYGRLSKVSVKVGDILDGGDALGEVGEPDDDGRNLYFEVRRGGAAIDPTALISQKLSND